MSLTIFVKLKHIREKFKTDFNRDKYKIKFFRNILEGDTIHKENIGFFIGVFRGKANLICDSYGRIKQISSIEDLTRFFTYSKYGQNLCWFYNDSFNFEPILNHLPEQYLKDIKKSGKTEYYAHSIENVEKKYFQVKVTKSTKFFRFYDLKSLFNTNLDDAAREYLNYHRTDAFNSEILRGDTDSWNKNYDHIVEYCIDYAKLVKNLADHYVENNISNNTIICKKIINIPQTTNSPAIGTAFDYLFRFLIKAHNPTAITHPWIAYESLNLLKRREKKKAESIIKDAEEQYSKFLREREINDDLISSTLLLAKLDFVYRTNFSLDNIEMDIDHKDIADLKNQILGVPKELYIAKKKYFLNPSFGLASHLVGGADADLLIGNTLIDIKTTSDPNFTTLFFNQLMGYVLLHDLGCLYSNNIKKVDGCALYEEEENLDKDFLNSRIAKIGIYFSRFNHLSTIDLNDVLPEGIKYWEMLEWFEHEAHKEYGPLPIKKYFRKSVWKEIKFGKISVNELLYPNQ